MGFEIDERAFRAQNLNRDPGHLVRELVQNVFDEEASLVEVTISWSESDRSVEVIVEDDVPRGFTDPREIWTIFASGKKETPTKRGRMGRGLKEIIAVSDHARVETVGKSVSFDWNRTHFQRKTSANKRRKGTRVFCRISRWKKRDVKNIEEYLMFFNPPDGISFEVNDSLMEHRKAIDSFKASLPTVFVENEVQVKRVRKTEIRLYKPEGDEDPFIFEMGIPVEKVKDEGFPYHVDIQQRIPLRPERDVVPRSYLKQVYALVANRKIEEFTEEEVSELWMEEAVSHPAFDKEEAGKVYVKKRFGDKVLRASVHDHDKNVKASREGFDVVSTRKFSGGVRELLKGHTETVDSTFAQARVAVPNLPEVELTDNERVFLDFVRWLAEKLDVRISGAYVYKFFGRTAAQFFQWDGSVRFNRVTLGHAFFVPGDLPRWASIAIHELAHHKGDGHDETWQNEVERLAGLAFQVALENADFIREKGWE
jgi:hypothetical protein